MSFSIDDDFPIIVKNPESVFALLSHLDSASKRIFANFFCILFLSEFNRTFNLYPISDIEQQQWGITRPQQRFEQCSEFIREHFSSTLTSLLIRKFTNKQMIEDAYDIANRTMKIIIETVENDETIPSEHKIIMMNKLKSVKLILAYPEELLNLQNVEAIYNDLNLTGNEPLLELAIGTLSFNKKLQFKKFQKADDGALKRNEATRWADYTDEDQHLLSLYDMNEINTICKSFYKLLSVPSL